MFESADIVSTYTRSQALEDGYLVDVSAMAREIGFRYPVAVTRAVWEGIVQPDDTAKVIGESPAGRLWDVLWMLKIAVNLGSSGSQVIFTVAATKKGVRKLYRLKSVCSPGDTLDPVITVMMPWED